MAHPCRGGAQPWRSGRSSDSRILLPAAPSRIDTPVQWLPAAFVPDHSGGPVPDFHGVPFALASEHPNADKWQWCRRTKKSPDRKWLRSGDSLIYPQDPGQRALHAPLPRLPGQVFWLSDPPTGRAFPHR